MGRGCWAEVTGPPPAQLGRFLQGPPASFLCPQVLVTAPLEVIVRVFSISLSAETSRSQRTKVFSPRGIGWGVAQPLIRVYLYVCNMTCII